MKNFVKIFMVVALIISFGAKCSAESVGISEDNLEIFLSKCNQILKVADAESQLDIPNWVNSSDANFSYSLDNIAVDEKTSVQITYALKDDKVFAIRLFANGRGENVQNFFEGMSIIFLEASGLSELEAQNLSDGAGQTEWQNTGFVTKLNKRFVVRANISEQSDSAELLLTADDTKN